LLIYCRSHLVADLAQEGDLRIGHSFCRSGGNKPLDRLPNLSDLDCFLGRDLSDSCSAVRREFYEALSL
jgi:hypothetical protein